MRCLFNSGAYSRAALIKLVGLGAVLIQDAALNRELTVSYMIARLKCVQAIETIKCSHS